MRLPSCGTHDPRAQPHATLCAERPVGGRPREAKVRTLNEPPVPLDESLSAPPRKVEVNRRVAPGVLSDESDGERPTSSGLVVAVAPRACTGLPLQRTKGCRSYGQAAVCAPAIAATGTAQPARHARRSKDALRTTATTKTVACPEEGLVVTAEGTPPGPGVRCSYIDPAPYGPKQFHSARKPAGPRAPSGVWLATRRMAASKFKLSFSREGSSAPSCPLPLEGRPMSTGSCGLLHANPTRVRLYRSGRLVTRSPPPPAPSNELELSGSPGERVL